MATDDPIVIYRSVNREGATFALKPSSREQLKDRLGEAIRLRSRLFITHQARTEYNEMPADLGPQIVQLLTGLSQQRLEDQVGRVVFRDPATDADIPLSAT